MKFNYVNIFVELEGLKGIQHNSDSNLSESNVYRNVIGEIEKFGELGGAEIRITARDK